MTLIISLYSTQLRRKNKHPVKSRRRQTHHIRIGGISTAATAKIMLYSHIHAYIYAHKNSTQLNFSGFDEQSKSLNKHSKQVARFLYKKKLRETRHSTLLLLPLKKQQQQHCIFLFDYPTIMKSTRK